MKRKVKKKILINTPDLSQKGGVASLYNMLQPFFEKDVEYFYTGARDINTNIFHVGFRILRDYFLFVLRIVSTRCTIVLINPSLAIKAIIRDGVFILLAKLMNLKVIVFFHGWKDKTEQLIENRWKRLFCLIFFRADAFIVLAEKYKIKLKQLGYNGNIAVGNTCVSNDFLTTFKNRNKPFKKTDKAKFTILFLTRIEKEKGIYEAVYVYEKIKRNNDKVNMVIAGSGSELPGIQKYVQEKNIKDIEFKGFVDGQQKIDTFIKADCYLFTSYSEGMPVSVLEAMAAGLPVVTTPVGGLVDFFEPKKMGYMISLEKIESMIEHIENMIKKNGHRIRIGEYNKKYAQNHFSALRLSKMLKRFIEELQ